MNHNFLRITLVSFYLLLFNSCQTASNTSTNKVKETSTSETDDQLSLANNYARDGLLREAVSTYKKFLASSPENHIARRNLSLVLVKMGDYKQATFNFEKVIQYFQKDFDSSFYYAEALRGMKQYADAIFWYKNSLLIKENDEKALKSLAWSYFTIKYYSEALKIAKQLYSINPKDIQSSIIISRTFIKLNRPKDAVKILASAKQNVKNNDPIYATVLSIEGEIYYALNNFNEAKKLFEEALKLQPLLASALIGLGRCQIEFKQHKEAIELIERAIRIKPKETSSYYYLALAYEKVDYKKAIKYYQVFSKRAATDPEYLSLSLDIKQKINELKQE